MFHFILLKWIIYLEYPEALRSAVGLQKQPVCNPAPDGIPDITVVGDPEINVPRSSQGSLTEVFPPRLFVFVLAQQIPHVTQWKSEQPAGNEMKLLA